MGSSGPRVALDPATGAVAATEEDLGGNRLVGEYDGILLVATDDELIARDADGEDRWRQPLADLGPTGAQQVQAAPDATPGDGMAFVGDRDGYALVDLADGRSVARDILDTATDPSTGVHVTVDHGQLRGYGREGELRWEYPVERGTRIASAAGGTVYLREGGQILTRDASTGEPVEVYGDPTEAGAALPEHAATTDATVLQTSDGLRLATTEPAGDEPAATARTAARAPSALGR